MGQHTITQVINNINVAALYNYVTITKLARLLIDNSKTTDGQTRDRTQHKLPETALLSGMET